MAQHPAVSLWLTGAEALLLLSSLRLSLREDGDNKRLIGKPEAYRKVLWQSHGETEIRSQRSVRLCAVAEPQEPLIPRQNRCKKYFIDTSLIIPGCTSSPATLPATT